MNRLKTLKSSLTRFFTLTAIALSFASLTVVQKSTAQQIQPVVVRVKSFKGGKKMPIDWRVVPSKQRNFRQYVIPNDRSLKGARIFQTVEKSNDLTGVLKRALALDGFESVEIMGNVPLKRVRDFDTGGKGNAFAGQAILNGQRYRFAAVGFYMTFDTNPRVSSYSIFAAPEDVSIRMGGFMPVSSTYFDLNGDKVKDLILEAGRFEPKVQAMHLANATDTYLNKVTRTTNSANRRRPSVYPGSIYNDGPCTGVSGTDPDAYGITGLGNPDC